VRRDDASGALGVHLQRSVVVSPVFLADHVDSWPLVDQYSRYSVTGHFKTGLLLVPSDSSLLRVEPTFVLNAVPVLTGVLASL
jgi:hypothetical protein